MTKVDLYNMLSKFDNSDMIVVNDEVIIKNINLNDDYFNLHDFSDDEEIDDNFEFNKVSFAYSKDEYEIFEDESKVYITKFEQPAGCVPRYNIVAIEEKDLNAES